MKKLLQITILITFPLLTNAQLTGEGTFTNPWSGTLSGEMTWSGTKYINGDINVDNEKLTITNGSVIIFLTESSNLIIKGTGQIDATGTSENMITFTSDDDNDGNYGESSERWGHIYLNTNIDANISIFEHCIIEFGSVVGSATPTGGGIYGHSGNLKLNNSIIRNNSAYRGGGLFLYYLLNLVSAKNNIIENNYATENGGGIYIAGSTKKFDNSLIHNNSSSSGGGIYSNLAATILQNCLIYSNSASINGSGIFFNKATSSSKIINTTIAANSTTGNALDFEFLPEPGLKPLIINTIIWGSSIGSLDKNYIMIRNCAIEGLNNPEDHTASFSLSSDNDNPNGPNFMAIDGSNWVIKYTSPCLNKGINAYGSPNIIPTTDILGNSRVLLTDIGAYEYQYSRWKTTASSTDWGTAGNWDGGVPVSTKDIIVPAGASNYPTASPGPDFTIGAGKQLIIESGARATLNSLTNNGIIKLNHNSTNFASLILNSYTRGTGGTEEIQLYLAGGGSELFEDYKWHYISTPVSSISTDLFTVNTYNFAQFVESRPSVSLGQGWVAYDGYVYSTGLTDGPTFSSLTPAKGYNYFNDVDNTYSFGGLFNTSDVAVSLSYTTGTPATMHGFNLLGNPFSSGLNWDDIIDGVYYPYPANTSKGLYFTRNNEQCSYIAGVGVPADVNGIIPPMQGFFNKTSAAGNTITLSAAARTHNNIHSRYKGETIIPLVRLAIFENQVSNDETVVRFNDLAKSDLDNDYDAIKMFLSSNKTSIHTSMGGTDYAINGQPFPEPILEIPVVVNLITAGTHKISATQLQGLDNYSISLTDKTTGFTANLKSTPDVTFSASAGTLRDRFTLTISNASTGTEDRFTADESFNIYHSFNKFNIQTLADEWDGQTGSVKVFDISGKTVSELRNAGFSKTSVTQLQAPGANGLYFIEIRSGMKKFVGKVVIK